MNTKILAAFAAVLFSVSAGAQQSGAPAASDQDLPDGPMPTAIHPTGPTVILDTSMGRITCQLFEQQAPVAVANFVGLAQGTKEYTDPQTQKKVHGTPYYDGTTFHRVIPEFMIQGGDPTGTGMGDPGYSFGNEVDPNLNFDVAGRLAMANTGEPNSNGSQFFITELPQPSLNQKYTIFGRCDDPSVNVVKTIARVQRDDHDKPLEAVVLKKVTIVPEGQPVPPATGGAQMSAPKRIPISAGVAVGLLESHRAPIYPENAKQARISGTVVLQAVINKDGSVQDLKVVSGPAELQQAALDAVKDWRYRPYLLNGEPVEVLTTINVIFTLAPHI